MEYYRHMGWAIRDSIPGRGKRFFYSVKNPDQLCQPTIQWVQGSLPRGKVAEV
jgi:hypothetical protein